MLCAARLHLGTLAQAHCERRTLPASDSPSRDTTNQRTSVYRATLKRQKAPPNAALSPAKAKDRGLHGPGPWL